MNATGSFGGTRGDGELTSYAAASLYVPVSRVRRVDFPTEGKPTNPTRVSPALLTSKPLPPPPPAPLLPPPSASRSSLTSTWPCRDVDRGW